jgi:DNA-binding MarR family transcriptional regulator
MLYLAFVIPLLSFLNKCSLKQNIDYTDTLIYIRKIVRSVNLETKRIEKKHDISIPQLLTLTFLRKQSDYQSTSTAIKNYLMLNSSTLTGIITRLESKNWIAKVPSNNDRRSTRIVLTIKGLNFLDSTPEIMHDVLSKKLEALSPEKLKDLQTSFEYIVDFLDIEKVEASPIIVGGTNISNYED